MDFRLPPSIVVITVIYLSPAYVFFLKLWPVYPKNQESCWFPLFFSNTSLIAYWKHTKKATKTALGHVSIIFDIYRLPLLGE